ncbi:MAG: glucose-6-phosphate isomerase [Pseudomonadota bacterium]
MATTQTPSRDAASTVSRLRIDADTLFAPTLGEKGIDPAAVRALASRLQPLLDRLPEWRQTAGNFLSLPYTTDSRAIQRLGDDIAKRFDQTVVFGIGGSSLGGEMLVSILARDAGRQPVRFFDNIDPASLKDMAEVDWSRACLLVISKSGATAETLCQLMSVLPMLEKQIGTEGLRDHIKVITENRAGPLYKIAERLGLEILEHPPVGGRFSVLSIVGLLPAAIAGVDIDAVLTGARRMADRCQNRDLETNPAFWNGAAQHLHGERGRTICVQMTYCDRLRPELRWYRQLWAESLGKRDQHGKAHGLTPVLAHGVTDQHSQLQLYLAGPDDKQFTFLTSPSLAKSGTRIPERFMDIPEVAILAGHTMGELFAAEFEAIRTTLTRHGRPHRTLSLLPDDAQALGELIVLLEMETVVVAELLGVDPFDQPAVEEGKVLARDYLKRFQT